MGPICFEEELPCPVAPHRMFHALFVDSHHLIPKIMPHHVKSVDFVSGEGGPGSVQQVNFADGSPVKYVKNKLEHKSKDDLEIKYTVIECDAFGDKVDHITNEVKFVPAPGGGCICKSKSTYHPKAGVELNEAEIKAGKESAQEVYKFVEKYLVENPGIYA